MLLKLKNLLLLLFISYVKAQRIVNVPYRRACVCRLRRMMETRAPNPLNQ
jgi:hypothetical protein